MKSESGKSQTIRKIENHSAYLMKLLKFPDTAREDMDVPHLHLTPPDINYMEDSPTVRSAYGKSSEEPESDNFMYITLKNKISTFMRIISTL